MYFNFNVLFFFQYIIGICSKYPWVVATILCAIAINFYKKHIKNVNDHYKNQIEHLKLQNEMLLLKNEYENHKHSNEKYLSELRQHNEKIREEIVFLRERKHSCDTESETTVHGKSQTGEDLDEIHMEVDIAKAKRHRFGALRRSLSSSSIPSEHDEEILTTIMSNKMTNDLPVHQQSVIDYVSSLPTSAVQASNPTMKNEDPVDDKAPVKNFLRIPEITITDTISFNNYDVLAQTAALHVNPKKILVGS
jgi:hypothetical protein